MTTGTASESYWRSTIEDGSATVPAAASRPFHLPLWGLWPQECTWMANPSDSGGEGRSGPFPYLHYSLLETHSFFSTDDTFSHHHFTVQASQTNLTRSIPGECNLYRGQCPSPIQGSFDPRPLCHYIFFSFFFLGPTWSRQSPLFGFLTPKPGNAPSQSR
jgi:hypothetical protein